MVDARIKILRAIGEMTPLAYGNSIQDRVNAQLQPNWLTRRWPTLDAFRRLSAGGLYTRLDELERKGLIRSEWGLDRPAERGFRRRRYYFLTEAGHVVLELKAMADG